MPSSTLPANILPATPPRATARLQFHKDFTLDDAAALVPYLAGLGVSHLYASPLLTARPGSTHGYDIVDHAAINPELGGEAALRRLVDRLRAAGMGLILDIVPNHMGVGGADNGWWQDVLEWGRGSPYASFFDIDWEPADPAMRGKMLAPFLGATYGECLERGELRLSFDGAAGRLFVDYGGNHFPINPRDYAGVLRHAGPAFAAAEAAFAALGAPGGQRVAAEAARMLLARIAGEHSIEPATAAFTGTDAASVDRLHRLLERQAYRLCWWRAATDEINWRRFFDVNALAGVRIELPDVFEATHRYVFELYAEGLIDGVRVDHVDGLADPRAYCRKLRRRLDHEAQARPVGLGGTPAIIWVEKILAHGERLASDWLTDGTTGYDYMNDVSALLHDPAGEGPLTHMWTALTGRPGDFEDEARTARRQILREALSSELFATATALHRIARRTLTTRDYTLTAIRRALEEIVVHFSVYRIYAGLGGISVIDAQVLERAMAGARRTVRSADIPLLERINIWLSGSELRAMPGGPRRMERLRAMVRFQQLTAPVAAKSVEDTAFYRSARLLSRNEVGSEPQFFATSPGAFHELNRGRQRRLPRALLATATHDHKRGEDSRMRLAVLSELPGEWEAAVQRWMRLNAPLKREIDSTPAPDAADELLLYQSVVGAWPLGLSPDDAQGMAAFIERLQAWQQKALREAKRRSEWASPNEPYEQACQNFLVQMLDPARPTRVAQDIAAFVESIASAGALNGLSQTLLRLTTPGIPDLYQGDEFWDFSLVDPDNRRPVDFAARQTALQAGLPPAELLAEWRDGRVKQAIIARALAARMRLADVFAHGAYQPLKVEGPLAAHVLAFARHHHGRAVIVAVTRLAARLIPAAGTPMVPAAQWQATSIVLPRPLQQRKLTDVLSGQAGPNGARERIAVSDLLRQLPVAIVEL